MLDLGQACIGIGFIDQSVELFHSFPDGHLVPLLESEVVSHFQVIGDGLLGVLLFVEGLDPVTGVLVLPELGPCPSRHRTWTSRPIPASASAGPSGY